jgi:predicted ester cyclase
MNYSPQFNAIDIHEFDDGKIVRTWHIEDWMTGLRQLAIFEK